MSLAQGCFCDCLLPLLSSRCAASPHAQGCAAVAAHATRALAHAVAAVPMSTSRMMKSMIARRRASLAAGIARNWRMTLTCGRRCSSQRSARKGRASAKRGDRLLVFQIRPSADDKGPRYLESLSHTRYHLYLQILGRCPTA